MSDLVCLGQAPERVLADLEPRRGFPETEPPVGADSSGLVGALKGSLHGSHLNNPL